MLKYLMNSLNRTKISCRGSIRKSSSSIYALASGFNQRCGVAVVRLSGERSRQVMAKLTKTNDQVFESRRVYLKSLWHPVSGIKIDKSLVVWFKGPNSFTGEDVCEFHVHGGPAIVASLLNALSSFENLRHAEPGEFSRRAFLNGKMDLVEIEGLADLVNAETEMQRRQALSQMEGSLSVVYKQWRETIMKCLANVEAYIDFNEEENVEENVLDEVEIKVTNLIGSIESHLNDNRKGERLRNGVKVAIIGQPNAGKSSLLNAICKRPAAIVSPIPGTTRDVIESAINIGDYPIVLCDTAGLRPTDDLVEMEGVKRAIDRVKSADIIIIVIDVSTHFQSIVERDVYSFLKTHLCERLNITPSNLDQLLGNREIVVSFNKKDLLDEKKTKQLVEKLTTDLGGSKILANKISADENHTDISELLDQLRKKLDHLCGINVNEMPSLTQERHRDLLEKCIRSLRSYLNKSKLESDCSIQAEELRNAVRWLGKITGHVTTEDILDIIFRDFCIGK